MSSLQFGRLKLDFVPFSEKLFGFISIISVVGNKTNSNINDDTSYHHRIMGSVLPQCQCAAIAETKLTDI